MAYDPKDVENLMAAVNEWVNSPAYYPINDYERNVLRAYRAIHPKQPQQPKKVVPEYSAGLPINFVMMHKWLSGLEAKLDALAERVK